MLPIQYVALVAVVCCFCGMVAFFVRTVRLGKPKDLSEKSGDTAKGILYANTKAMMPQNKESAYLHIPSYASGMLFHIGTFCSLLIFVLSFFPFFGRWMNNLPVLRVLLTAAVSVTCFCGYALLLKRAFSKDLKPLSTPDDYISNALTSTFQLFTVLYLCLSCVPAIVVLYYIACSLLFLYMPLGKLRHVVFYFAARYHLGFFYGWRNVWPNNED